MPVIIASRLLRKRIWMNLIVVLQIMLSVIALSDLFVYISDNRDNIRAIKELPSANTLALNVFEYYDVDYAAKKIQQNPLIESVGKVYYNESALCNTNPCCLVVYNKAVTERYSPALAHGRWLTDGSENTGGGTAAVVSADLGLRVGDNANVSLPDGSTVSISVCGVLKRPTQYLLPIELVAPKYSRVDMIIHNDPVVILSAESTEVLSAPCIETAPGLFLFSDGQEYSAELLQELNRYGETVPVSSMISLYNANMSELINSQSFIFAIFLILSVTGVLSSNMIQSSQDRKIFTVYYLLGMDWKQGAKIELCHCVIILVFTAALCLLAGRIGLLGNLQYLIPTRVLMFYGIVFLYVTCIFAGVKALFMIKLMREDISLTLRSLQQGE